MFESAPVALVAVLQTSTGSADPGLTAFVGLTGLVITGFLALARLSQQVIDDADGGSETDGEPATPGRESDSADGRVAGVGGTVAPAPTDPDAVGREAGSAGGDDTDDPSDAGDGDEPARATADRTAANRTAADRTAANRTAADRTAADRTAADRTAADPVAGDAAPDLSPGALLANVALTQGLFGAILAGGAVYFGVSGDALGLAAPDLSTGPAALAVGVGFGFVLWIGNELATGAADAAGAGYDEGLREMLAPGTVGGWALLLGVTLPIIAVVEEFIFRAAAVGATTAAFPTSPWAVAVVSSVAFALGHGAQGRVGIAVTGGLGFALAGGFIVTNSLLVIVVAHYFVNALEFVIHEGLGLPDPVWE